MEATGSSLCLDEAAVSGLPEARRPVAVYEWLRRLDTQLAASSEDGSVRQEVRGCQKVLVDQLMAQVTGGSPGPPTRHLIAGCMATLFSVGDTFLLFETINKCNDLLKSKDDSPSYLACRLAAIVVVGTMYQRLGRMMGRSYEETVTLLTRAMKSAESSARAETLVTLGKVCRGLGSAAATVHKEIFKCCRVCLQDRVMPVRVAAAECLTEMLDTAPFLYTQELDNTVTQCFRAFEGSNYAARMAVAKLLGSLLAATQEAGLKQGSKAAPSPAPSPSSRGTGLEEVLGLLGQGFLRGSLQGSFLKGSDLIKSGGGVAQEVRVGVAHSYVCLVTRLGPAHLERHLAPILGHVLELASSPRAGSQHTEMVCTRNCVTYILSTVLGRLLREKAQVTACREMVRLLARSLNTPGDKEETVQVAESANTQHLQVAALHQLGSLTARLGTMATNLLTDSSLKLLDTVFSALLSPWLPVRLAAGQCVRQVAVAVPSVLTPLLDKCLEALDSYKSSAEAVSGYSAGLAGLLGAVRSTPNGIPHTRGKIVFNCGEELLRSASQTPRLSRDRTRAGWLLIGGIMSLGSSVVRGLLPRCMLLWRNAFPRSSKELESEKARGDAFTWQVSLEARAGALASIHAFVTSCPDLVTEDITRRLGVPLEAALTLLTLLGSSNSPTKAYSGQLKAPTATVRLRLLEVVSVLAPATLETSYAALLRLLVAEFCLADPTTTPTSTQLLPQLLHPDTELLLSSQLGAAVPDQLERSVEDQLAAVSAAGSHALEHDHCWLHRPQLSAEAAAPPPPPLGVAVIDLSITVFGRIFPRAAHKHRLQMLAHFTDCIKTAKTARLEVLQLNIFTALLSGLKGLVEDKASMGGGEVVSAAVALLSPALTSTNPLLRCAAGECLGRIAQVVADNKFIADTAQHSFDFLKSARDVASRTGHSFALGCLHKYVGSLGSSQHLHTSVSILLALAQDGASPVVQCWAAHSLALIADSGGPMFRDFVAPTLATAVKLLLATCSRSSQQESVVVSLGRLVAALITTLGPELSEPGHASQAAIKLAADIMRVCGGPASHAQAITCLQQLQMFTGDSSHQQLVPQLVQLLPSCHLALRRAAVACLRQLAQRGAALVCEAAGSSANIAVKDSHSVEGIMAYSDSGLPGLLFSLLDTEEDPLVTKHAQETVTSILVDTAADNLSSWLGLCKEILTVSVESAAAGGGGEAEERDQEEGGEDDDDVEFTSGPDSSSVATLQPRWSTRVFAAVCLRRIITDCCDGDRAHFDLSLAREVAMTANSDSVKTDFLVLHLSELVRMCFMAATSDTDQLRLEGLLTMQEVIDKFAATPEPEFPGHVILEQYQAQVGAALRPAFAADTASHVTATACAVCSTWISSGVARDLADLRRVYQLLVTSLAKLKKGSSSSCYNESASTLEKLSILKAWAEVYIVSMDSGHTAEQASREADFSYEEDFGDFSGSSSPDKTAAPEQDSATSLTGLVAAELPSLSKHWLAALKDHGLLSLPPEFKSQLPYEGGAFYSHDTIELARPHYRATWPPILRASSIWLAGGGGLENVANEKVELDVTGSANIGLGPANATSSGDPEEINRSRFSLLLGVAMEALCTPRSGELSPAQLASCLAAVRALLGHSWTRAQLGSQLVVELCNVMHRQLLTQDSTQLQAAVLEVVSLAVTAAVESLATTKKNKLKDLFPANQSILSVPAEVAELGEAGEVGGVAFSVLELCVCVLVRYFPDISPRAAQSSSVLAMQARSRARSRLTGSGLSPEQEALVATTVRLLAQLPGLCSPRGCNTIMPTLLYLVTGVLKDVAVTPPTDTPTEPVSESASVGACLATLTNLVSVRQASHPEEESQLHLVVQSGLLRILDLAKTAPTESQLDEISLLLAIKVYLVYGPLELVSSPHIKYPCVNAFSASLQSRHVGVVTRALKILSEIVKQANISVSLTYIQATAPQVVKMSLGQQVNHPTSQQELALALECLSFLESLLDIAESDKKSQLLKIHIPVLINFLSDDRSDSNSNQFKRTLHDTSLTRLTKLGGQFAADFKNILNSNSEMRQRVERAVIQNAERQKAHSLAAQQSSAAPAQPSIKLKMDFSNFK